MHLPRSSVSIIQRSASYAPFPSVTAKAIGKIRVLYLTCSHINKRDMTHFVAGTGS